jgi:hypothetical protein
MAGFNLFKGIFGGKKYYGSKPIVPESPDATNALSKAIDGNLRNMPKAQEMTTAVNDFNQNEVLNLLRRAIPDYDEITQTASSTIASQLRGEIPQGVQDQIQNSAAASALSGGFGGSGVHKNLVARDLGLTSLEMTNRALGSAQSWIQHQRQTLPGTLDVTSMFVSPAMAWDNEQLNFQRNWLQAKIDAAPDPVARGAFDTEMQILGMALSAYSGGSGYQNTHKPQEVYSGGGGGKESVAGSDGGWRFNIGNYGAGKEGGQGGKWYWGKNPGKG